MAAEMQVTLGGKPLCTAVSEHVGLTCVLESEHGKVHLSPTGIMWHLPVKLLSHYPTLDEAMAMSK